MYQNVLHELKPCKEKGRGRVRNADNCHQLNSAVHKDVSRPSKLTHSCIWSRYILKIADSSRMQRRYIPAKAKCRHPSFHARAADLSGPSERCLFRSSAAHRQYRSRRGRTFIKVPSCQNRANFSQAKKRTSLPKFTCFGPFRSSVGDRADSISIVKRSGSYAPPISDIRAAYAISQERTVSWCEPTIL